MSERPTAGQATIEYVAAVALVATLLVLAAPAVGAPDLARIVSGKIRLALCVVADDVCSAQAAKDAGLAPCPLESDTKGHDVSVTAWSVEVGHRWTLTVTPQSDGTVNIMRTAGGTVGLTGGWGATGSRGPLTFELGAAGSVRGRVQAAVGWTLPSQAAADRFLSHTLVNSVNFDDFPPTWTSVEQGAELSGMVGGALGQRDRGDLIGAAAAGSGALGGRVANGGVVTLYGRLTFDGPELAVPFRPSTGRGRDDWIVEYTFSRAGPRELAFRRAEPDGDRVTETVARLDLRDPAHRALAAPLLAAPFPWGPRVGDRVRTVLRRIEAHGTVERTVSEVDDESWGASGHVAGGIRFGAAGKRIKVHRTLVEATARTGGSRERERFDCQRR